MGYSKGIRMKRILLLLLALVFLCPAALVEEEAPPYDWRADWEAWGLRPIWREGDFFSELIVLEKVRR